MAAKTFDQYELWADLSRQNRHLRRNNWLHWFVHLVLVAALTLMAIRPPYAIRVDRLGAAELVPTAPVLASAPSPEEAEHVSRLFSSYVLEVTSGSITRDLQKALGLMTVRFEKAYRETVRNDPNLGALEKGNIRTSLAFNDGATEIKAETDSSGHVARYFVTLQGRLDFYRADVLTAPLLSKTVLIRTTLLVVPRSKRSLNGLLVDFFEKQVLVDQALPAVTVNPVPASSSSAAAPAQRP
jgi:hypothetical protein